MVDVLLAHGANPAMLDRWGKSALDEAVRMGYDDVATTLRAHGARLDGPRAVMRLVRVLNMQACHTVPPSLTPNRTFQPNLPAKHSAKLQQPGTSHLLRGCFKTEFTPMLPCLMVEQVSVCACVQKSVLACGSWQYFDLTQPSATLPRFFCLAFPSALHRAADVNSAELVDTLVEAGASVTKIDRWDRTPLDVAEMKRSNLAAEALRRHGAQRAPHVAAVQLADSYISHPPNLRAPSAQQAAAAPRKGVSAWRKAMSLAANMVAPRRGKRRPSPLVPQSSGNFVATQRHSDAGQSALVHPVIVEHPQASPLRPPASLGSWVTDTSTAADAPGSGSAERGFR